jgi:hypothetical protein
MPSSRLFNQNLLTPARFSGFQTIGGGAVANASGSLSKTFAYAAGNALVDVRFNPTTGYTANVDKNFLVEIHQSTAGTFPSSRWRYSLDGGATWVAQNLIPVSGTWNVLSDGVDVQFTASGVEPEFVLSDTWEWRAFRPYGILRALDGSRNTGFRSGAMPSGSTLRVGWDLGSAQQPGALFISDHNLPSNVTTTLFAHPTTLFLETGGFQQAVTWRPGLLAEIVNTAVHRYWWVRFAIGASSLTDLRFSGMYLQTGVTFQRAPSVGGSSDDPQLLSSLDVSGTLVNGDGPQVRSADQLTYAWNRRVRGANGDGDKLDAAWLAVTTDPSYMHKPIWWMVDDSQPATARLVQWVSLSRQAVFYDKWDYTSVFAEIIRKVAS